MVNPTAQAQPPIGNPLVIEGLEGCMLFDHVKRTGRVWEVGLLKACRHWVNKQSEVIMAGAHYGGHVMWVSRIVGHVHAWEPIGELNKICERNLLRNKITNVSLRRRPLWSTTGELLGTCGGEDNSGGVNFGINKSGEYSSTKLDQWVYKNLDWIDLDVESAELEVLMGAYRTIDKHHPNLSIEIHERPWLNKQMILDYLEQFGYTEGNDLIIHKPGTY